MKYKPEETITIEKKYYAPYQEQRDNKNNFSLKVRKVISFKAFIFFIALFFVSSIICFLIVKTYLDTNNDPSSNDPHKIISTQNISDIQITPQNSRISQNETETPIPEPSSSPKNTDSITTPSLVRISYKVDKEWPAGATIHIRIQNTSATDIKGWKLQWDFSVAQQMKESWGGSFHQNGSTITVENLDWNGVISPTGFIEIGLNLSHNGSNPVPTTILFNGTPYRCQAASL